MALIVPPDEMDTRQPGKRNRESEGHEGDESVRRKIIASQDLSTARESRDRMQRRETQFQDEAEEKKKRLLGTMDG